MQIENASQTNLLFNELMTPTIPSTKKGAQSSSENLSVDLKIQELRVAQTELRSGKKTGKVYSRVSDVSLFRYRMSSKKHPDAYQSHELSYNFRAQLPSCVRETKQTRTFLHDCERSY